MTMKGGLELLNRENLWVAWYSYVGQVLHTTYFLGCMDIVGSLGNEEMGDYLDVEDVDWEGIGRMHAYSWQNGKLEAAGSIGCFDSQTLLERN